MDDLYLGQVTSAHDLYITIMLTHADSLQLLMADRLELMTETATSPSQSIPMNPETFEKIVRLPLTTQSVIQRISEN